jgi:XTP/dITP diphosphohydrolase
MKTLLLGTGNTGKIKELSQLLNVLSIELKTLADVPEIIEPDESGSTFKENALIKAAHYATASGFYTLADDSGLEVDGLDNRPGVFSARYAGPNATDFENNTKLLKDLMHAKNRRARFVCVMCLSDPDGNPIVFSRGECTGEITRNINGLNGFGYDPIFRPAGYSNTFAELESGVKDSISHRFTAAAEMVRLIRLNSLLVT